MADISGEELDQRVAIVKRFRKLLQEQRERFRAYLDVLDRQKDVIETGSADVLMSHVELEEKIAADIFSIQKVIDPLEEMYRAAARGYNMRPNGEETDLPGLKSALEGLRTEAASRSRRNRELLSRRMDEVRTELKTLRANPYLQRRPVYGGGTASLVDITG